MNSSTPTMILSKSRDIKKIFIELPGSLKIATIPEHIDGRKTLLTHAGIPDSKYVKKAENRKFFKETEIEKVEHSISFTTENFPWRNPSEMHFEDNALRYSYIEREFRT